MKRNKLLALLDDYNLRFPLEDDVTGRFRAFVQREPRCFERDCWDDGHVTASALVVNRARTHTLLTHHAKLGRWLQLGGHSDGDPDPLDVALREAREESGLDVTPLSGDVFDLDIHPIPQRKDDPRHFHYDVRFLLQVGGSEDFRISDESLDLQWVALDAIGAYTDEVSVLRMIEKFQAFGGASA